MTEYNEKDTVRVHSTVDSYKLPSLDTLPELKNDLTVKAAAGRIAVPDMPYAPVWVMRQAGRYLPEFLETRKHHSFFDICRTPELACEVTLQPIDRFGSLLSASIIFSDILVVPQAFGMSVQMVPGQGPTFEDPLKSPEDAAVRIVKKDVDVFRELKYVFAAITLTRQKLNGRVPLFGFCGAPWTIFAYMVHGSGSKTWVIAKRWLYNHPESAHAILDRITTVSAKYLAYQVAAGAQLLQVFDTNAGVVSHAHQIDFVLHYLNKIPALVHAELKKLGVPPVPIVAFPKGIHTAPALASLSSAGYSAVSIDWSAAPALVRAAAPTSLTLQGNLDPTVLTASKDAIRDAVYDLVWGPTGFKTAASQGLEGGWIANLGHGVTPDVPVENMQYFLETLREVSAQKHPAKISV